MSELPFLESCDTGSRRLLPSGRQDRPQQKIFACPEYIGRRCDRSEGTDCGRQLTALRLTPSFGGYKDDEPSDCARTPLRLRLSLYTPPAAAQIKDISICELVNSLSLRIATLVVEHCNLAALQTPCATSCVDKRHGANTTQTS